MKPTENSCPSGKEPKQQHRSFLPKCKNESLQQKCPYCVESENGGSLPNNSPSPSMEDPTVITATTRAMNQDLCESSLETVSKNQECNNLQCPSDEQTKNKQPKKKAATIYRVAHTEKETINGGTQPPELKAVQPYTTNSNNFPPSSLSEAPSTTSTTAKSFTAQETKVTDTLDEKKQPLTTPSDIRLGSGNKINENHPLTTVNPKPVNSTQQPGISGKIQSNEIMIQSSKPPTISKHLNANKQQQPSTTRNERTITQPSITNKHTEIPLAKPKKILETEQYSTSSKPLNQQPSLTSSSAINPLNRKVELAKKKQNVTKLDTQKMLKKQKAVSSERLPSTRTEISKLETAEVATSKMKRKKVAVQEPRRGNPGFSTSIKNHKPGQSSGRQPSVISMEDVGMDGGKAYIIRAEQREKVDWRRRPRYPVKQTTTSRLRYGYWFADCGKQRVKAFRGDWTHIPEELLKDWEVYQNYFRYRLKNRRKRTSSLVRKFIAGKYREKHKTPVHKRPIRKMSPMLPTEDASASDTSSPSSLLELHPQHLACPLPLSPNFLSRRNHQDRCDPRTRDPHSTMYRKPFIEVHSTFTSRMRKHSTIDPCSKPMTPTLWHGSAGEMQELKQKIEQRRQRLKDNWLQQTGGATYRQIGGTYGSTKVAPTTNTIATLLQVDTSAPSQPNHNNADKNVFQRMADLLVVGAPSVSPSVNASNKECKNVASGKKMAVISTATSRLRLNKAKNRSIRSTTRRSSQKQHKTKARISIEPQPTVTSSETKIEKSVVAHVTTVPPTSSFKSSESPVIETPLTNRPLKKVNSFATLCKFFSIAKWMLPPTIPIQQNCTSTLRRRRLNEN